MKLVILLMLLVVIGPAAAEEAGGSASALVSSQNADGSWGTEDRGSESQVYTTAKVLESLIYYGEESDAVEVGVQWLEMKNPDDTAALSEVIRVLHLSGRLPESELLKLGEYQNADGGWGKTAGFESTPWYTGSAIIALSQFGDYQDPSISGGEYLLSKQGENGNFEDSTLITSNCIYALVLLYDATKRDDFAKAGISGYKWLNNNTNSEGVWENVVSTSNSIVALDALYELLGDENVKNLTDNAKVWIANYTGSKSDVLATALTLTALSQETAISPAKTEASISAVLTKEHVFPSDVTEIRFKIENRGLANMKNISLLLVTAKELHAEIKKTGWGIDTLESGGSKEFKESIFIPADALVGEYPIIIKGGSISSDVTLHVLESPFIFEISPTELKNDAPLNFELLVKNQGKWDFFIKNIELETDENWKDVKVNRMEFELPSSSEESFVLFSAVAPAESGEYHVPVTINFASPELGEQKITFIKKFVVGGVIPSGVLKLVLYGTLILSVMMLLNLLVGYDLLG